MRKLMAIAMAAVLAFCLGGCNGNGDKRESVEVGSGFEIAPIDVADLSGGVAAEVGEVQIGENAVTAYINNVRYAQGLQDEQEWGQWIFDAGYSLDSLRGDTVEMFVNQELIRQAAAQENVSVSEEDVDALIADRRGDATDEVFAKALQEQGMDEAIYRENVRIGLLREAVSEKVAGANKVDDATLLKYLKTYYPDDVDKNATTLDGIDEERVKSTRELVEGFGVDQEFSMWMHDFRKKVKVTINLMPEGLPYYVDLASFDEAANFDQGEPTGGDPSSVQADVPSAAPNSAELGEGAGDEGTGE